MKSGASKVLGVLVALLLYYGGMQWFASSKHLCQITFVPIGNFPSTSLQTLASYYEQTLGLHIDVRPTIPFEDSMIDRSRGQLIGEELINKMKIGFPALGCCRFQRHRVRCMNETGGEPWSDESLRGSSSWRR